MRIKPLDIPQHSGLNSQSFTAAKLSTPKFTVINGIKIMNPIIVKGNTDDSFITAMTNLMPGHQHSFQTFLTHSDIKNRIGLHEYIIRKEESVLNGLNIGVNRQERKYGFGEILRLISIIHMKENNLKSNVINSLNEAIPFHIKYHFISDNLNNILSNNDIKAALSLLNDFQNRATNVSKEVAPQFNAQVIGLINEIKSSNTLPKNYLDNMRDILYKYFKNNTVVPTFENGGGRDFSELRRMVLTLEDVKTHSDFFNELFNKHGLNYKV